jgi:aryl-alcohol dehydrogenase
MKNSVGHYNRVSTEEESSMSKNTTQIKAAVVREKGGPFSIETLSLESPRRDEVLVKVVATGLCHTDMVARDKVYPVPHPIVLGHEGAGIVVCDIRTRQ